MELNMDMEKLKQSCSILHVQAFNSTKKRRGISMRKKDDNTINVHWKGAAEMVLAMCSHYYDVSGEIKILSMSSSSNCSSSESERSSSSSSSSDETQATLKIRVIPNPPASWHSPGSLSTTSRSGSTSHGSVSAGTYKL
ncbi:Calcium-transporting ATPase 12, plasma membrane-type [Camellia lanceoleosa]|uniref:Calcium-transporting ATPase 12, plasma membrane-type n=1 Tax=Camellia lanceoleosa TaxID=1840588 RepID=A0ACC0HH67_9ERIC|nr:Calcium-transporting ATPase 12, plasma membrane-type [Camellia lanceoleosa]